MPRNDGEVEGLRYEVLQSEIENHLAQWKIAEIKGFSVIYSSALEKRASSHISFSILLLLFSLA